MALASAGVCAYGDQGVGEAAGPADDGGRASADVNPGVGLLHGLRDELVACPGGSACRGTSPNPQSTVF